MKSTRVLIRAKGRGLCIERGLYDCLQRELFADVTFICEGGKIRANKGVLAAASPVLSSLLKDWPLTEDPCIIMAGYSKEEVQGLVRYIYTGQLSAPRIHGSSWEKIIGDFKVGAPLEHDDDLASIHELTDYGEDTSSPKIEPESNGVCHQSPPMVSINKHAQSKTIGPKIVAVTSPRPLIVQVQSLTQAQSMNQEYDQANDVTDIPNEMTIDESNKDLLLSPELPSSRGKHHGIKRKRVHHHHQSAASPMKKVVQGVSKASPVGLSPPRLVIKKAALSVIKKGKSATSKFARKKYVCPHCNRRFLTRGNVKNHLRTHTKDKPFQCSLCQELFAYQGVYQRHLLKHLEKKEIDDVQLAPMIAESQRLADEIAKEERKSVRVLEDEDEAMDDPVQPEKAAAQVEAESSVQEEELEELVEEEEDENGELIEDEEARIALKLQGQAGIAGSSKSGMGTHFLCADDKMEGEEDLLEEEEEVPPEEGKAARKRAAISAKGKKGPAVPANTKTEPQLNKVKYQVIECDFCPMKYHKWSAFYVHRCSHTGESPVFPCGVCSLEFPNIKALKEHKASEHRESMFQCDGCDRTFLSRSALMMHQPIHSTDLNFQCRYCSEKMRTLKERYIHEKIHTTEASNYQCSHCDKQFNTLVNLRSHLKVHGKEPDSSAPESN